MALLYQPWGLISTRNPLHTIVFKIVNFIFLQFYSHIITWSLSIVKKCPHFQYQRNLARASCHQCICLLSFWGILGTHLATQWFCSHFGVKISFFSLFWGLQIPSSSATTHFPRAAALHCCCCCCVTLSAVSAWSGLASTLGIKQKSVLSQVTSEDGSPPHPHAMHLNTHAAVSLPISSPPQKLIVFQSQKNSWYPWYCEDGWWLYFSMMYPCEW